MEAQQTQVENTQSIAKEILAQLGGNRFIVMTGAKHLTSTLKGLHFKIGRNDQGINWVRIVLDDSDTYTMEFLKIRVEKNTVVKEYSNVYCDQLQKMFTAATGLRTHL